jgi:hypothetical protein
MRTQYIAADAPVTVDGNLDRHFSNFLSSGYGFNKTSELCSAAFGRAAP